VNYTTGFPCANLWAASVTLLGPSDRGGREHR